MSTHLLQDAVVAQAQLLLLHPLQTLQNALVNRMLAKFSQGGGGEGGYEYHLLILLKSTL
jgi:hypothetical protein